MIVLAMYTMNIAHPGLLLGNSKEPELRKTWLMESTGGESTIHLNQMDV